MSMKTKMKMETKAEVETVEGLIEKWKKDLVPLKEEWDRKPGWPAKLVRTEFVLDGVWYEVRPEDLGLTDDCWDQGFMESYQKVMSDDLKACGATKICNMGFLD